jgi:CO dehydrogenase nickel-insertion accessory protein CooC1
MPLFGIVPYDECILKADMEGETPLKYRDVSKAVKSIYAIGKELIRH